ncbi:hypothetical protein WAK64_06990 [Bacillus spongiae]|uniref:Uncharacterized protein n=1 Tax=Bacillus spongiae TaxID=2683610 RepID=A0ABU8HBW2_9BACI
MNSGRFSVIQKYIMTEGRELEKAMWRLQFAEGSEEDFLTELARYQNDDGGFGKGLEPDIRCELSSAIASTVALQLLSQYKVSSEHTMVKKVIRYLLDTFNKEKMGWDIVPQEVEWYPRAPWWNYREQQEAWGNPNAEILGFLYEFSELVPPSLIDSLTDHALTYLQSLEQFEFHEFLCFHRLIERVPVEVAEKMEKKFIEMMNSCVTIDREKWSDYCLQPIDFVQSPASAFYDQFVDVWRENLQFRLHLQEENGSWTPMWTWGNQYEKVWEVAKKDWTSVLTLKNALLLKENNPL